ncbi:MAG: hypothetical protein DA408_17030 [Bacteroidetes bacterium]|nr:MAG: hypothetical protein C7N36_06445 [Bacteroidota bacterium]PTM10068.1 MAG: hypothetical protein DA408_17030 [Bacteroidota bacterium]
MDHELPEDLNQQLSAINSTPLPALDNLSPNDLSPNDLDQILNHTFEDTSPIGFRQPNQSAELFKTIFQTNCREFNMGYHDGYPQEVGIQRTLGYTLYLLLRYGGELRNLDFYVEKNLLAFPFELAHFPEKRFRPEKQYANCYEIRIYERFLNYYGLIDYHTESRYSLNRTTELKTTPLFGEVFELRPKKFKFRKGIYQA